MARLAKLTGSLAALCVAALVGLVPTLQAQQVKKPPQAAPEKPPAQPPAAQPPAAPPRAVPAQRALPPRIRILPGRPVQFGVRRNSLEQTPNAQFVQPQRERLRALSRAEELLEQRQFADAVKLLGDILASSEDGVLPGDGDSDSPLKFMKAEALRMVGEMSAEGQEAYRREYSAAAQKSLEAAIAAGDVSGIERVAGQYFHTPAGNEATLLLGNHHLDHGRAMAAALCFQRLRQRPETAAPFEPLLSFKTAASWLWAGMPEHASKVLLELKKSHADAVLQVAGEPIKLFANDAQALHWLSQAVGDQPGTAQFGDDRAWSLFRGDSARNAASAGSRPLLNHRWQVPVSTDPQILSMVGRLQQSFDDQNLSAVCGLHPLVVHDGRRDVVLARTAKNLLAIDFATGKRIWEAPVEINDDTRYGASGIAQGPNEVLLAQTLDERLWDDAAYGTLSSDGVNVYAIEDLVTDVAAQSTRRTLVAANGLRRELTAWPTPYNRLAAYDLSKEGKLRWALGGPSGEEELPEADTFFLGPPLPVAGRLYVLAETKGQIRVLAIDPRSSGLVGQSPVEWSQPLADLEQNILDAQRDNRLRRLAGAVPSYGDGVLVCPTTAGAVAAVDVTTRSLLWGYLYTSDVQERVGRVEALQASGFPDGQSTGVDRWVDGSATIAEGRVLLTPVDSTELHCLHLVDGRPAWKIARDDGLYVACVHEGTILIVGRDHVRGVALHDGASAWDDSQVALPSGASPSGRGFFAAGVYYLPLTTAEVLSIDVATGKLKRSVTRHGSAPGNLISYKGAVISQSPQLIERFEQLDIQQQRVAEKLAQNPNDAAALVEQAEILLDAGDLPEAVDALRRSYQAAAQPRTRRLLVESMLQGLRSNFATHRDWGGEIERLAVDANERAAYQRALAQGLHKTGDRLAAFQAYLKVADLTSDNETLEQVDPTLTVRQDRWLQGRLPKLRADSTAAEQQAMDQSLRQRFQAAVASEEDGPLRRFIGYFDGHPLAEEARFRLAKRLTEQGVANRLEIELLLRHVEREGAAELKRAAVARLAQLLLDEGRPLQAVHFWNRLTSEFANEICLDGKTGKELADALPGDNPLRAWLGGAHPWPVGKAETKAIASGGFSQSGRTWMFDLSGSYDPSAAEMSIELTQNASALAASDGLGRPLWSVPLENTRQRMTFGYMPTLQRARALGNCVALVIGNEVLAIDGLRGENAKILWKQNLSETIPGLSDEDGVGAPNVQFMRQQFFVQGNIFGANTAILGPLTDKYICFQRVRNLVALDPLTGETLWVRRNVPAQSQLFGDDEVIVVVPPGENDVNDRKALLFSAVDGQPLGERIIPGSEPLSIYQPRAVTRGRHVFLVAHENGKKKLKLFDPLTSSSRWESAPMSLNIRVDVWREQVVAAMEPSGRILLLDLDDGRVIADQIVEPVTDPNGNTPNLLSEIHLVGSRDHLIVLANSLTQNDIKLNQIQPVPFGNNNPFNPRIHGKAYGFDRRSGKALWSKKVESQGIMLQQPSELPVLAFAVNTFERNNPNSRQSNVMLLDKRTGRTLHERSSSQPLTSFELVADLEQHAVEWKAVRDSVRINFTDEPLPPEDEAEGPEDEKKQSSILGPVLKGLLKEAEKSLRLDINLPANALQPKPAEGAKGNNLPQAEPALPEKQDVKKEGR